MIIKDLFIQNFRSIKCARIRFSNNNLLCGQNNIGKSTIIEAINLVLGPDRIGYPDAINEFDFYKSQYIDSDSATIKIRVEIHLTGLNEMQKRQFSSYLDFWDTENDCFIDRSNLADIYDEDIHIQDCLRVHFVGEYNLEDDEFTANTFYSYSPTDDLTHFGKRDKRDIGFLYLRYLRTGSRALSLEDGSLLDIIMHLKGIKFNSWERMLKRIRGIGGAIREEGDFDEVLKSIESKLSKYLLLTGGNEKSLQFEITNLTRKQLKDQINLFISTLPSEYPVPFRNTGSGTINLLLFAMLNIISELKKESGKNVIFAMEEPEIALPPSSQRKLISELKRISNQTIVTSHSPYITEQFLEDRIIALNVRKNRLVGIPVNFQEFKEKRIKSGFRNLFSEGILSNGIIAVEGISDKYALYAVSELLYSFDDKYLSLDLTGISIIDSGGSGDINKFGSCFRRLTKKTFALYDKGKDSEIDKTLFDIALEIPYEGIEDLLVEELPVSVIEEFYTLHVNNSQQKFKEGLSIPDKVWQFLKRNKGTDYVAKLMVLCKNEEALPKTLVNFLKGINANVIP